MDKSKKEKAKPAAKKAKEVKAKPAVKEELTPVKAKSAAKTVAHAKEKAKESVKPQHKAEVIKQKEPKHTVKAIHVEPQKKTPDKHEVKTHVSAEIKKHAPVAHHEDLTKAHTPLVDKVHPKVEPIAAHPVIHKEEIKKPEVPVVEIKPEIPPPLVLQPALKELELELPISVKDLSVKLQEKASVLIKCLMDMRVMAGINQSLSNEIAAKICEKYGFKIKEAMGHEESALSGHNDPDLPENLKHRSPIVTIMGHVDHGKTSILDAIRSSKVAESEHGGITQHIGAYKVNLPKGDITFLDTPGHEAFTAMRARGAKVTDIVVLVVAADDGIMPQTQEAIDHAKAAGVSIIVALNKIDKPQADPDKVKKQLSAIGLMAEDWGGKIITVPVSAKTGQGIDTLLDMIILEAEMLELKANPDRQGKGVVLEAKMVKSKGPVVTFLVQSGTVHLNENIIVGGFYGKIKAMFDDHGRPLTQAGPSTPVEVLGITGIPEAGEQFYVIEDEKIAKELAFNRKEKEKQRQMLPVKRLGLEDLYSQIKEGKLKELNIIIKADAQGSGEAIKEALTKINSPEVRLNIIHDAAGSINSSDVILALASGALILGFNVTPDEPAKILIDKEGQDVRVYNVIYELVNDIKAALEGMLAPKLKRIFIGRVEVRKVFKLSSSGTIAGCFVLKGKIPRNAVITLTRNGAVVLDNAELASLKRFKDDVREVEEGFECGLAIKGFPEVMEGDVIEACQIQKIARTLD
jgi:translation initiation factor IF-2